MSAADTLSFFRAWLSNPLQIAAIAPSSTALARLMTSEISAGSGPVLELGPGTGAFTRALLVRGVPERDLILIEHSADFASLLQRRFPAARVRHMDAARLATLQLFETGGIGGVVSGLPLLSMSPRKVMAILCGAFGGLHPDGAFYQFTYGPNCPVSQRILDRLGLKAKRIGGTLVNMPPASVYRITKRPSPRPLAISRPV
ncbi:class I SAM-dependent methyltransferase [Lysobacter sp. Hz 25]|uniref:class I SAM-dependent methyltransferase n=1 Tax=Lysobacter sp. Hz 25 TaxID=3383698 RepID=UPI0038D37255